MAGRGMGAATQGGGCVTKGAKNRMLKPTSKTTGPILMNKGGEVNAYEVLGRRVSKKEYEDAARIMDTPQSDSERSLDDFAKRAKQKIQKMNPERLSNYEEQTMKGILKKKNGGAINLHKKMAMGKKRKK
jgi:hypothetical protein